MTSVSVSPFPTAETGEDSVTQGEVLGCLEELTSGVRMRWMSSTARAEVKRLRDVITRALAAPKPSAVTTSEGATPVAVQQQPLFCVLVYASGSEERLDEVLAEVLAGVETARREKEDSSAPEVTVLRAGLPHERTPEALVQELCRQARLRLREKNGEGPGRATENAEVNTLEIAVAKLQKHGPVVIICDGIEWFCGTEDAGSRSGTKRQVRGEMVENSGNQYLQKHSIPSLLADIIATPIGEQRVACVATSTVLDVTDRFPDRVRSRDVKTVLLRPCSEAEAKSALLSCLTFPDDFTCTTAGRKHFVETWNNAVKAAAGPESIELLDAVVNALSNDPECVPKLAETVIASIVANTLRTKGTPTECVVTTSILQDCALRYCSSYCSHWHIAASLSESEATVLTGLYYLSHCSRPSSLLQSSTSPVPGASAASACSQEVADTTRSTSDRLFELFRTCGATSLPAQLKSTLGIAAVLGRLISRGYAVPVATKRKAASDDVASMAAEGIIPAVCTLSATELAAVLNQMNKERRCGSLLLALLKRLPLLPLL